MFGGLRQTWSPVITRKELSVRTTGVRGPRLKAFFAKKAVREINVGLTVQKVSEIQAWSRQVYCVDLKIPPIERAIGRIVVIDLARTS